MLRHVWVILSILRLDGNSSNLAFEKPSTISTMLRATTTASRAVDGNNETRLKFCAATTQDDMEPWWMVDLHGYFHIHDVTITTINGWFLHSFSIDVFTENPIGCARATSVQCYNRTDPLGQSETKQFRCHSPVIGPIIRVKMWKMLNTMDILFLCEVQVFGTRATGCLVGWMGFGCVDT
ncbi:fucolectin-4-like isoform X1 [Gigantopelta aegis]|uniref:fucolectin-4-like isoform X1 n=1 Tax=Gigantopelta aegis TaxID=1735272 RepID=UPI001B88B480|nr:fucolectin-4-like isoform X1 [Gigantopelta aegis]